MLGRLPVRSASRTVPAAAARTVARAVALREPLGLRLTGRIGLRLCRRFRRGLDRTVSQQRLGTLGHWIGVVLHFGNRLADQLLDILQVRDLFCFA
ncbi:hypothetical protein D3C73_942990 [compost metagenome]